MKRALAFGICLLAAPVAFGQDRATVGSVLPPTAFASPAAPSVHPSVVRIVAPGNGSVSYGSGTLVHTSEKSGIVITNWHVVNEASGPISVHFPDGFYSLGAIERVDRDWDLAAITIRKPPAEAVPLAMEAPRPGEVLTIAGYGQGNYRAVSGRCTQYVAPGTTFPFEMVEVAVSARQGDSGGPIFNSRGELAGVLFGEGHGRTSGSYCGRVRWFLSSVVPSASPTEPSQLFAVAPPIAVQPPRAFPPATKRQAATSVARSQPGRINPIPLTGRSQDALLPEPKLTTAAETGWTSGPSQPPAEPNVQYLGWEDLAGETLTEQVKTVLAGIGAAAILLHGLRWLGTERAKT